MRFEYKVVPAPTRGKKAKGVKGTAGRFAQALSDVMNDLAADSWEYLRTDTLPAEERSGLTGHTTVFQNMLVFRRAVATEAERTQAVSIDAESDEDTPAEVDSIEAETAEDASGSGEAATDAPDTGSENLFLGDVAESHAPKLPSAKAAQGIPDVPETAPEKTDPTRDVAAE